MFQSAVSFNCDISKWDVQEVRNLVGMFEYATGFKRQLCGPHWYPVSMPHRVFHGSSGSIARRQQCSKEEGTRQTTKKIVTYLTHFPLPDHPQEIARRPITERELIVHTPITTPAITSTIRNGMTCPKCGIFEKSGRISCCAPGGAWYRNCGGAGNRNVNHRWMKGVEACKRKFKVNGM